MLDYTQSLRRLLENPSVPKLGLSRMHALLEAMGRPDRHFQAIHVAGTNGKGSTCAFLRSLLEASGKKTGLYTSPHLLCARERIQINGELISEALFCAAEEAVFVAAQRIGEAPTFFERITAMAFWVFADQKVDTAVVEVGLGGRLDATNVITPTACVITRIDLDHQEFLGDTLAQIAAEKAGIIKPHTPVVTGFQAPEVQAVIARVASERGAPLIEVDMPYAFELGLLGAHQQKNAALALAALGLSGRQDALERTKWPGRFERFGTIVLDGAHNAAGMSALVTELLKSDEPLVFVIGTSAGHDAHAMAEALAPLKGRLLRIVATRSASPRAQSADALARAFCDLAPCEVASSTKSALEHARDQHPLALTVVTGSLFVVGEVRASLTAMPKDPELPAY